MGYELTAGKTMNQLCFIRWDTVGVLLMAQILLCGQVEGAFLYGVSVHGGLYVSW